MTSVWRLFDEVGPSALLLVPVLIALACLVGAGLARWHEGVARVLAAVVVAMALVLVLVMTMKPATGGLGVRVDPVLDPRVAIEALLRPSASRRQLRLEAVGNLLLLMPLGAALRFVVGWRPAALLVLAVAFAAEVTQWAMATGRTPDVLDLVLNTTGGLVGIGIASAMLAVAGVSAVGSPGGPPGDRVSAGRAVAP